MFNPKALSFRHNITSFQVFSRKLEQKIVFHVNTTLSIFADDTNAFSTRVSHARAKSNVQSHLNKLHDYYQKWKIRVNVEKSEALIIQRFKSKAVNNAKMVLEMDGKKIPYRKSVRYLGYYVQPNLKHNGHVNRVLLKA